MTTHASVELMDAMSGDCGTESAPSGGYRRWACRPEFVAGSSFNDRYGVFAWIGALGNNDWAEDAEVVDCPDCLRLVILARGERQDVIELREAAAITARVNAELNAEKEKAA
jgi:hypothetical protein